MLISNNGTITPKNGNQLNVVRVARISTANQDIRSLDAQLQLIQNWVEQHFDGKVNYIDLATRGSGEILDRQELFELETLIESGENDLVICEDLARVCRRTRAIDICEMCEDHDTRLIAINDRVDTADESWRDGAMMSSWHHERSNQDTSNRIRREFRTFFMQGSLLHSPGPFYVVPEGAKKIDEVQKNEDAHEIVEGGFRMLENGSSYSEVADWLNNEKQFPVGGDSRKKKWNCHLVKSRFLDPKLKGVQHWNKRKSKRNNKTGRRRSVNANPSEILTRNCEHLRFVETERFDALVEMLKQRNSIYQRSNNASRRDPLRGRAKKRTPFPGQSIYCGICGRKFVYGGHGRKEFLMCDGAREYACWNGAAIDGRLAAQKIVHAVWHEYEQLPDFDEMFLQQINEEADRADSARQEQLRHLRGELRQCEQSIENLIRFISSGDYSSSVRESLAQAEQRKEQLLHDIGQVEAISSSRIEIPTMVQLRSLAREAIDGDIPFSWATNKVMRRLISRIVVFPCRLIDGGRVVNRAKFRLHPGGLLENQRAQEALELPLEKILTVDLFEPPQREACRADAVAIRNREKLTLDQVGDVLGITSTAVQRAMKLQRLLDDRGVVDAYEMLDGPPEDDRKLSRHKHPRYHFDPLADAGQF